MQAGCKYGLTAFSKAGIIRPCRIKRLLVFNKEDMADPEIVKNLCRRHNAISISAIHTETLGKLLSVLEKRLWPEEGESTRVAGLN